MSRTELALTDLTEGYLDGLGVFDKLMQANKAHLVEEFKQGRITGHDYSQVYIALLNSAMQQAVQWLLTKDQAAAQADLLRQQARNAEIQEGNLLKEQDKLTAEIALINQQVLKLIEETALTAQKAINAISEKDLLDKQVLKLDADILLSSVQQGKLQAETSVLDQKHKTEQAQIQDVVDGSEVTGVIGKQKALQAAQTDGFARDAEQKAAKLYLDTWNIRRSVDANSARIDTTGLDDSDIKTVMDTLKAGVTS